ncbi:MAG: LacI family transcriptional regulator [Actinobacteria bacterium]|nr:LacI family transcriptional regulator [Actinomycetota bacterium]
MTTIKDVADRAGVSTSTVSHVINNTRFVSEETKQKVLSAIEELSYYQNAQAKSLATGKSHIIGLIVSDITNPFFPELIRGAERNATQQGYDVFLGNTDYDPERTTTLVRRLIEHKADGVIIITSEIEYKLISNLTSKRIPVVLLDWGITDHLVSNIKLNFNKGIEEAINHLVNLGHRNIAFISGSPKLKSVRARKDAFISSFKKYIGTVDEPIIIEGDVRVSGGEIASSKILDLPNRPTAILAINDLTAIGAIKSIKERGLQIPDDISVIGFDDILMASSIVPPLTTINLPRYKIGEIAWSMLHYSMEHKEEMGKEETVDTALVVRGTTGKAVSN